jgi:hypothetical protein
MSSTSMNVYDHVGPVLQAGTIGSAVVAAIRELIMSAFKGAIQLTTDEAVWQFTAAEGR